MTTAQGMLSASVDAQTPRNIFGYEVVDFLGEGAGSLIYVVSDPQTRQIYALKHVRRRREKDERFFEQLENEFDVGQQFKHPALRRSIDLKDNHTLFRKPTEAALVLELFDGTSLEARRPDGPAAIVACFLQVAQGLASLHSLGLAHCDLKPGNILVNADGRVKIIDFGQTCRLGSIKERIQGTPDFIAPEQVRCEPITARTDVFNLGATLYWTLTRKCIPTLFTLHKAENSFLVDERIMAPRDLDGSIPEPLSNLVMECIRTNASRRPNDMPELARRLDVVHHAVTRRAAVA